MLLIVIAISIFIVGATFFLLKSPYGLAWKTAGSLPLLVLLFTVFNIVIDVGRNPTSHNLWPFEIMIWGSMGVVYLIALYMIRKIAQRFYATGK